MLMWKHQDLGGVTNGTFRVRAALREGLPNLQPRPPVGTQARLNQVIDPTIRGKEYTGPKPEEGTHNTYLGLLDWSQRHESVVVPMVYPWAPQVARPLSNPELLTALDVPATKIKGAGPDMAQRWAKEITLPFKVRAEVSEWLYSLLAPPGYPNGQLPARRVSSTVNNRRPPRTNLLPQAQPHWMTTLLP